MGCAAGWCDLLAAGRRTVERRAAGHGARLCLRLAHDPGPCQCLRVRVHPLLPEECRSDQRGKDAARGARRHGGRRSGAGGGVRASGGVLRQARRIRRLLSRSRGLLREPRRPLRCRHRRPPLQRAVHDDPVGARGARAPGKEPSLLESRHGNAQRHRHAVCDVRHGCRREPVQGRLHRLGNARRRTARRRDEAALGPRALQRWFGVLPRLQLPSRTTDEQPALAQGTSVRQRPGRTRQQGDRAAGVPAGRVSVSGMADRRGTIVSSGVPAADDQPGSGEGEATSGAREA